MTSARPGRGQSNEGKRGIMLLRDELPPELYPQAIRLDFLGLATNSHLELLATSELSPLARSRLAANLDAWCAPCLSVVRGCEMLRPAIRRRGRNPKIRRCPCAVLPRR